jgi:hypothetical protein
MSSLTGIRTYGAESFCEAFSPIFEACSGFYFCESTRDSCFRFPLDDDSVFENYKRAAAATDRNGDLMFSSSVLFDLATIVDEDWNAIQLLDTQDFRVHRTFEKQRHKLSTTQVARFVQQKIAFFHNYDGCFWQFFTNIDELADTIISAHRDNPRFDLRYVDIAEHYWNVGEFRDDFPPRVG